VDAFFGQLAEADSRLRYEEDFPQELAA